MLLDDLISRSENKCELCNSTDNLSIYEVPPIDNPNAENCIFICSTCKGQIEQTEQIDQNHWKILSETMWSTYAPVQVVAWRMLSRLRNESWASDNLDILYLDDETLAWAKRTGDHESSGIVEFHLDSNGTRLQDGDTVVLTK